MATTYLGSFSPPALLFNTTPHLLPSVSSPIHLKKAYSRKFVLLHINCLSKESSKDAAILEEKQKDEDEDEEESSVPLLPSISPYNWCATLGGLGFLETAYLTYIKLTNSEAFCPIAAASCANILNSDYAILFGVPLPLIGLISYGLVTTLSLQLADKDSSFGMNEANSSLVLLATTTSMATASTYFLYILITKFPGDWCAYCLFSALLSFSLLFTTLKASGLRDIKNVLGLQLCVAGLVVTALSTSYNSSLPPSTSTADSSIPFFTTEITMQSSPYALSLARHLQSIGAKMYGAFWCTHCIEQKQMFGSEAAKLLNYIECFPDGYRTGVKIDKACANVGIEGFPTWVINGQVLNGEKELSELAQLSGFELPN